MKHLGVLALFAVLGFAAAGCGATKKIVVTVETTRAPSMKVQAVGGAPIPRTITVVGRTATIPNVENATRIKCKGWVGRGVEIPPPGSAANVGEGVATPGGTSSSKQIELTRRVDGSLTVTCGPPS